MGKIVLGSLLLLSLVFAGSAFAASEKDGTEVGNGRAGSTLSVMDDASGSLIWTCYSRQDSKSEGSANYSGEALFSRGDAVESAMRACEDQNGGGEGCAFDGCIFRSEP